MENTRWDREKSHAFLNDAMERYADMVYRLALFRMNSPSDADDVFQEVFLALLKTASNFQSEEHLKAWLLRATIHRSRDMLSSSWFRRTTVLEDTIPAPLEAEESDLYREIVNLPVKQRTAIHLHYYEGYSTDEIADLMETKPSTVRSWLHRGRETLKKKIGGERYGQLLEHGR